MLLTHMMRVILCHIGVSCVYCFSVSLITHGLSYGRAFVLCSGEGSGSVGGELQLFGTGCGTDIRDLLGYR